MAAGLLFFAEARPARSGSPASVEIGDASQNGDRRLPSGGSMTGLPPAKWVFFKPHGVVERERS